MSKKNTLISLIVVFIVGSLMAVQASNMFFSDVANFAVGLGNMTIFATFPALNLAAILAAAFLFILRCYLRPQYFRAMSKLYLIIVMALSGLGILFSILAGAVTYHNFVAAYPFKGYLIIFMVVHALILGAAVFAFIKVLKLPQDQEKMQMKASYVFKTIGWFLFIYLVFNRAGTLFGSPVYIQWRTLYLTFPFYLFLLLPICIGVYKVLLLLDIIPAGKARFISNVALLSVTGALFVTCCILGATHSEFISAVSQAMPLERLASKPLEIIIHFGAYVAVLVILLVQHLKAQKA